MPSNLLGQEQDFGTLITNGLCVKGRQHIILHIKMRPIPSKLREEIASDPFMKKCVYTGETKNISWEHCWIYAGKQVNEAWAIVPLRRDLNVNMRADVKEYCQWVSINRAIEEDFKKYPKKDWQQLKRYLNDKYKTPIGK